MSPNRQKLLTRRTLCKQYLACPDRRLLRLAFKQPGVSKYGRDALQMEIVMQIADFAMVADLKPIGTVLSGNKMTPRSRRRR